MADSDRPKSELARLAQLALSGRRQDIEKHIRRLAFRCSKTEPATAQQLYELLNGAPSSDAPLLTRAATAPVATAVPVDVDSRLQLIRSEYPAVLEIDPIWAPEVNSTLHQVVTERRQEERLNRAGLNPTRSLLFVGSPGVGKTLAARWLARELDRPLLILDLSAVISSFLGRTGNNVRHVLDYAKSFDSILLLDEIDAIAKRRDDGTELGELKRLVTVLLQEIDDWPSSGLLIAATNHPELLDRAIWRRFDEVVPFPMPTAETASKAIVSILGDSCSAVWHKVFATAFLGHSFSDIERHLRRVQRSWVLQGGSIDSHLESFLNVYASRVGRSTRKKLALELTSAGFSQRRVSELTGVSRDTMRRAGEPATK